MRMIAPVRQRQGAAALLLMLAALPSWAQNTLQTDTYRRMRAYVDGIPAIDTHEHLQPFVKLSNMVITEQGPGLNLYGVLQNSYYSWINPLAPWLPNMTFERWWPVARNNFDSARATTFYRFLLPAFKDLYGIDFDSMTDEQARELDRRIYENYKAPDWIYHVVTERANIELIVNDPYWARITEVPEYTFAALVFNVTPLVSGFHRSQYRYWPEDPYHFADQHQMKVDSLDDYLNVLDALFQERKRAGAICLKSTLAYERTLHFEDVPRARAEAVFGKPRAELSAEQVKTFEDFIMWRLVELAARYDLPFQIHTGQARIQGSNPMLLVDLIGANPKTKFVLFHGGYPWVSETAVIGMRHTRNVWLDSCWLPTLSYAMAKRAYHEWLDAVPSNKILWGGDGVHAEGIYGATVLTRRCVAEVLAERVDRGELREEHAQRIARQIFRDNALELFPSLKERLWKHQGEPLRPPASAPAQGREGADGRR
jgi:hypothetical protein